MRRLLIILLIAGGFVAADLTGLAEDARADKLYHTDQIALVPVDDAPLKAGHVINIHPNGPQIFARERYFLSGATPSTTYQVNLLVYPFEPECDGQAVVIPTAELKTNGVGNGTAQAVLRPADIGEALHNNTHGVSWEITLAGETVYEAAVCSSVALD